MPVVAGECSKHSDSLACRRGLPGWCCGHRVGCKLQGAINSFYSAAIEHEHPGMGQCSTNAATAGVFLQVLEEIHADLAAKASLEVYHQDVPSWHLLVQTYASAAKQCAAVEEVDGAPVGDEAICRAQEEFHQHLDAVLSSALLWAQSVARGAAAPRGSDQSGIAIPECLSSMELQLGLRHVQKVCSSAVAALIAADAAAGAGAAGVAAALAQQLCMLGPMLSMLRSALQHLGMRYLATHQAVAKLSYITCSLFSGLVEEGFCMPEGAEGACIEGWLHRTSCCESLHWVFCMYALSVHLCSPGLAAIRLQARRRRQVTPATWQKAPALEKVTPKEPRTSATSWRTKTSCWAPLRRTSKTQIPKIQVENPKRVRRCGSCFSKFN